MVIQVSIMVKLKSKVAKTPQKKRVRKTQGLQSLSTAAKRVNARRKKIMADAIAETVEEAPARAITSTEATSRVTQLTEESKKLYKVCNDDARRMLSYVATKSERFDKEARTFLRIGDAMQCLHNMLELPMVGFSYSLANKLRLSSMSGDSADVEMGPGDEARAFEQLELEDKRALVALYVAYVDTLMPSIAMLRPLIKKISAELRTETKQIKSMEAKNNAMIKKHENELCKVVRDISTQRPTVTHAPVNAVHVARLGSAGSKSLMV